MWERTRRGAIEAFHVLREAVDGFGDHRGGRMAAAVGYRTMFALAPLLLIAVYILGIFFGDDAQAREELLISISRVGGTTVRDAVDDFLQATAQSGAAGIIGFALLLWTGSSLFLELQQDLNDIFGMPAKPLHGALRAIRQRAIGFLWSLVLGVLLIGIWLLNAGWQYIGDLLPESFDEAHQLITFLAPLISFIVLPLVFALGFQTLARSSVAWPAVWRGAFFTTVLFLVAAYGAGVYFRLGAGSAAGIAGSIFVILLLAYVLSAVFLFGAEVTRVLDERRSEIPLAPEVGPRSPGESSAPAPALPAATVFAFLAGFLLGRWRRR